MDLMKYIDRQEEVIREIGRREGLKRSKINIIIGMIVGVVLHKVVQLYKNRK